MFHTVLNTSLSRQLLSHLSSDLILCAALDSVGILAYSALYFFMSIPVYSVIFSVIEVCSRILRRYKGILRLIQTYSACSITLTCSRLPILFRTEGLYLKPCESLNKHIHPYSGIFRTLPNACIRRIWHTRNPGIYRAIP